VRILEAGSNFWMALLETIIATIGFVCLLCYLKPIKQEAKILAKQKAQAK